MQHGDAHWHCVNSVRTAMKSSDRPDSAGWKKVKKKKKKKKKRNGNKLGNLFSVLHDTKPELKSSSASSEEHENVHAGRRLKY